MIRGDEGKSIADSNVLIKKDHPLLRYGVAILSVMLALLITQLLEPLRDRTPFPLFFAAVSVSAWYGGIGPGLLTTALSALTTEYFFLPKAGLLIVGLGNTIQLTVFVLVAILISSLDTARKRAEREKIEKLKESGEKYISLWENAEDPMFRTSQEGKIIAINRRVEEVIGYPREEIVESDIRRIIPDYYHDLFNEVLKYALIGEKAETAEIEVLTRDKGLITMEIDMRGIVAKDAVIAVQIHLRDVSKRKEIEQELINTARFATIGELTAELAHEINNPIGVILGFSQEVLSEMDENHPHYKSIKIITEEAKRCKNVMKHLLTFARPPSFKYSSIDIGEIINESFELILHIIDKRGIAAKKIIPADLPRLHADPSQIKGVLINLYNNAIDAMPQGGDLIVSASLNGSYIRITVSDTGKGINKSDLSNIFMHYFSTKEGGTGIGLSTSKRIIDAHKGKLEVESRPGVGTSFIISLPIIDEEDKMETFVRTDQHKG